MLLSIIVPVFNGEKYIVRCLESFSKIEEKEAEFIVINDGSTDCTKELVQEYIKKDSRICLINQENAGVGKARNKGLSYAAGNYIGFVDADDEITTDYNEIIQMAKINESDLYSFDFYVKNKNITKRQERYLYTEGINDRKILYNNFLKGNSNCVWNNLYKNDIIRRNNIHFSEKAGMGEDCTFNAQYFGHCKNVFYMKKTGYKYYADSQGSASKLRKISYLSDFVKVYDAYKGIYKLDEELEFLFDCPYYFDMVYDILQENRGGLSKEEKNKFRQSEFFKTIINCKYNSGKREIKKWIIKWYVYFK